MGIMPSQLCSNNYLPADFASPKIKDDLIGAELEDVVTILPIHCRGKLRSDMAHSGGSAAGSFPIGSFPF